MTSFRYVITGFWKRATQFSTTFITELSAIQSLQHRDRQMGNAGDRKMTWSVTRFLRDSWISCAISVNDAVNVSRNRYFNRSIAIAVVASAPCNARPRSKYSRLRQLGRRAGGRISKTPMIFTCRQRCVTGAPHRYWRLATLAIQWSTTLTRSESALLLSGIKTKTIARISRGSVFTRPFPLLPFSLPSFPFLSLFPA